MATYEAPECKPKVNEKLTTAEHPAATDGKKPLSALRGSMPFLPDATEQDFLVELRRRRTYDVVTEAR